MRPVEVMVTNKHTGAAGRRPTLWFDLTDLAVWSGALTGIQRVMAGLATEFLREPGFRGGDAETGSVPLLRFCYFKRHEGFFALPDDATRLLLGRVGLGGAPLLRAKGQSVIGSLRRRLVGERAPFAPGDALFYAGIVTNQAKLRFLETTVERLAMPVVVIVHDVIPLKFREWCKVRTFQTFEHWFAFVTRAKLILTPSDHTRKDVEHFASRAGITCPPLAAVPLPHTLPHRSATFTDKDGGKEADVEAGPPPGPARAVPAVSTVPLPESPYALYVSTIEPRKNHRLLFYLWKRLLDRHPTDAVPDLVLLGKQGWQSDDFVSELSNAAFLGGKIRWIAEADDALLAQAYQRCAFTVFPSFYEGYGLPVAESLGFGKPCIASDQASIPEVGGDLVDYFDPYELSQAYALVETAIFDEAFLAGRSQRIRERFHPTGWPEYARHIGAEIRSAIG
ncbi:MAG: glycosyltransferase family 1 protein [Rhodospirillales bacterium]